MRIAIDSRLLERGTTGIGRYLMCLIQNLGDCDTNNEYYLISYGPLVGFEKYNCKCVNTTKTSPSGIFQKLYSPFWMNFVLPRVIKKNKIDVFFSPNHFLPLFRTSAKSIIFIHDVFQKVNPKFHSLFFRLYSNLFLSISIKRANLIITSSESSKRDIKRLLHVPEDQIVITNLTASEVFSVRQLEENTRLNLANKYNLPGEFILYVGVIEERKNIEGIIKIANLLLEKNFNVPIVLIGRIGHNGEKYLKIINNCKNMLYVGFVSDTDLPLLYNLASVFIFPSFYEGFGIPPLEAMRSGIPVITSNVSSLPEVVGDGGIMLDPADYLGFVNAIVKVSSDKNFRNQLIKNGLIQAEKFSARSMACKTVDIFNKIK